MESVLYSLFTHWGIFLLGFVAGIFWASRPVDEVQSVPQRHVGSGG